MERSGFADGTWTVVRPNPYVPQSLQDCRLETLAEAVSEFPLEAGNGTGRAIPDSRRLLMDRLHKSRRAKHYLQTTDKHFREATKNVF